MLLYQITLRDLLCFTSTSKSISGVSWLTGTSKAAFSIAATCFTATTSVAYCTLIDIYTAPQVSLHYILCNVWVTVKLQLKLKEQIKRPKLETHGFIWCQGGLLGGTTSPSHHLRNVGKVVSLPTSVPAIGVHFYVFWSLHNASGDSTVCHNLESSQLES